MKKAAPVILALIVGFVIGYLAHGAAPAAPASRTVTQAEAPTPQIIVRDVVREVLPAGVVTVAPTHEPRNYVLNTKSYTFHYPSCNSVSRMSPGNSEEFYGSRDKLLSMGYHPCGRCSP